MSYKLPLTNLQNVVAGNTATLKLPTGKGAPTYDQIKLILSGGALPAHIDSIRGKANGRIFMDESNGTDLKKRHVYRGIPSTDGFAVIEQLVASVPGNLLQDLTLEIKLTGAFVGSIKAAANYRPPTSNPFIRKLLNTAQAFAAAGTDASPNIMYLPTGGAGGKMKRIWIHEDGAGAITGAQIRIANNVVYDAQRTELEDDQKRNGLTPQASICVLDFVEDGNLAGMLDTSSYRVYYELIDPITRL
jgi:hypothetical protein